MPKAPQPRPHSPVEGLRQVAKKPFHDDAVSLAHEINGVIITEIVPMEEGEWVSVAIKEGRELRYVRLTLEQYAVLKPTVGEVCSAMVENLEQAGKLCDAVRKGMELLGYGAMSPKRMTQKLTLRGFDKETVTAAVNHLARHGLLPECDDAVRFAEQGVRKLWGPRRIREDLFARGFSTQSVTVAMESLEDVDFFENCTKVIEKKYGGIPEEPAKVPKMIAALIRLGYTSEQIREAMKRS